MLLGPWADMAQGVDHVQWAGSMLDRACEVELNVRNTCGQKLTA